MRHVLLISSAVFFLFLSACGPEEVLQEQPDDTAVVTGQGVTADSDNILDNVAPTAGGGSFDPENPAPAFDLPEEPLTPEDESFFRGLLEAIISEAEKDDATESVKEIIRLNEKSAQYKKNQLAEKEMLSGGEKRRQRLAELTAKYLKELQGRHVGASPRKNNINTAAFPPGLAAIGAEPIPAGGAVVTDKTQEAIDRIEAERLAQQQLAQEELTQPIQPPQKTVRTDQPPTGGHWARYFYDIEGNVVRKNVDGIITKYFVTNGQPITPYSIIQAEYDAEDNRIAKYYYTIDHRPTSQERNGHRYSYLYDGMGNVGAIMNENGEITDRYEYNGYGELLAHYKTENSVINHFLAKGEYFDEESGFYRLRARPYDPKTGRFVSMDMWQGNPRDPVTLNKYLYANANPITYHDPSGHASIQEMMTISNIVNILNAASIGWTIGSYGYDAYSVATGNMDADTFSNEIMQDAVTGIVLGVVFPKALTGIAKFVKAKFFKTALATAKSNGFSGTALSDIGKVDDELLLLNKKLANEEQLAKLLKGEGVPLAKGDKIRVAQQLVDSYGGEIKDWVKISSKEYKAADGATYQIHAYYNEVLDVLVEPKTIIYP